MVEQKRVPVLVTIQYPEGKGQEKVQQLCKEVTSTISRVLQEPEGDIRITVKETSKDQFWCLE